MKKILFVLDTLNSGGSQRIFLNLVELLKDQYNIELLLINEYGVYLEEVKKKIPIKFILSKYKQVPLNELLNYSKSEIIKIIFYKIILRGQLFLKFIKYKSNKILKNEEYEIIIGYQEGPSNYIVANIEKKIKKIIWLHSDINQLSRYQTSMEKNVYNSVEEIICVSEFVKSMAIKKYPSISSKIKIIYNPINFSEIRSLGLSDIGVLNRKKINLVTIGRLSPEKGYIELLETIRKFLIENSNYILNIIGDGYLNNEIKNKIFEYKLENQVFLHGFISNPYIVLKESDIYISSSIYEGLPTTILEAIAFNKYIIANNIEANVELLRDYKKSDIINIFDESELRISIKKYEEYLGNDKIENKNFEKKFSYKNFLNQFEEILK